MDVQTDVSPAALVHAVEASLFSFFPLLAKWPRAEAHDEPEMIWTISDVPFPLFNSVLRARLPIERTDAFVDGAIARCAARHVPLLWWTGPGTAPGGLESRLESRGFVVERADGMAADLHALPPGPAAVAGLAIEAVHDPPAMAEWCEVLCEAFGATQGFGTAFADAAIAIGLAAGSPFQHYLGRIRGTPVATCSVLFAAGVAGIYDVATAAGWRRRGIGAAVTQAAIEAARAGGYRVAVLHASPMGAGVYRSLGFRGLCRIAQCVWVPWGEGRVRSAECGVQS